MGYSTVKKENGDEHFKTMLKEDKSLRTNVLMLLIMC